MHEVLGRLLFILDSLFTLLACLLIISTTVRPQPQTITATGAWNHLSQVALAPASLLPN